MHCKWRKRMGSECHCEHTACHTARVRWTRHRSVILRQRLRAADMEALGLDGETWEDLDGLEADFVQTNATHQPNRSWLMA